MEVAEVDVGVDAEVVEEKEEEEEEERNNSDKIQQPSPGRRGKSIFFCSVLLCFLLALLMFQNLSPCKCVDMPQALVFDQTCPSTGSLLHIHISTCFSTHIEPAVLLHKRIIAPEPFNTYIQHMCLRNTVLCQAAMLLHQKVFTPTSFYTSKFYTSKLLHRHFFSQALLFHKLCVYSTPGFLQANLCATCTRATGRGRADCRRLLKIYMNRSI